MSKRVLIISELFEPFNSIGAVRPSKLAKYLTRNGIEVTVFTSHKTRTNNNYAPKEFKIIYDQEVIEDLSSVKTNRSITKQQNPTKNAFSSIRKQLSLIHRQYLAFHEGKIFCRRFVNAVNCGRVNLDEYDYIFTTFGPIGPVLTGVVSKRLKPRIIWINDFRDPMVSQMMPSIAKPLYAHIQRKSIILSDYVTTVSEGYKKRIQIKGKEQKVIVIPNGFDVDDKPACFMQDSSNSLFSLSYVGALYEGKRDLSPLFKTLRSLLDEGLLSADKIVFNYAGKDIKYLVDQAKKYCMENIICNHGFLAREECLLLQSESRFLVLSTWNEKGEEGVFPGKFIEYMLMEKPIISLVDGALAGSEVTSTINRFALGISYERADSKAENKLYEWLKEQAVQFNKGEPVIFSPDHEALLNSYDWRHIAERFCEIING